MHQWRETNMLTLAAIVVPVLVLLIWVVFAFNRLVVLKNNVTAAWHQIDVQLKRRHDLIPNLVAAVKGYMEFEKETLEKVVEARAAALSAAGIHERAFAEERLTVVLGNLFAVVEKYPTLKSNENVMDLQEELTSTENRIAFARQFYNDLVANLRSRIEVFPDNIIAALFAFHKAEYFSAEKGDRALPSADISAGSK
jgi:LemA protein